MPPQLEPVGLAVAARQFPDRQGVKKAGAGQQFLRHAKAREQFDERAHGVLIVGVGYRFQAAILGHQAVVDRQRHALPHPARDGLGVYLPHRLAPVPRPPAGHLHALGRKDAE